MKRLYVWSLHNGSCTIRCNNINSCQSEIERKKTEMVGACPRNGGFQNPPPAGHAVGTEKISLQEEAGTAKGELDGHREAQPEEHGHQLGGGRRAGGG